MSVKQDNAVVNRHIVRRLLRYAVPYLGWFLLVLAIIVATFSSVAMSGIPGCGGTGELVLCTVFFPEQMAIAYPIAIALGNLIDPPATMVNAAGDYVVSFIVSRFVDGKDWLSKQLAKAKR